MANFDDEMFSLSSQLQFALFFFPHHSSIYLIIFTINEAWYLGSILQFWKLPETKQAD
jgi:hypothetical protein